MALNFQLFLHDLPCNPIPPTSPSSPLSVLSHNFSRLHRSRYSPHQSEEQHLFSKIPYFGLQLQKKTLPSFVEVKVELGTQGPQISQQIHLTGPEHMPVTITFGYLGQKTKRGKKNKGSTSASNKNKHRSQHLDL